MAATMTTATTKIPEITRIIMQICLDGLLFMTQTKTNIVQSTPQALRQCGGCFKDPDLFFAKSVDS